MSSEGNDARTLSAQSKICTRRERGVGKSSSFDGMSSTSSTTNTSARSAQRVEKKTMRIDVPERHAQVDINMAIWDIIGHVGFRQLLRRLVLQRGARDLAVADLTRRETSRPHRLGSKLSKASQGKSPCPRRE